MFKILLALHLLFAIFTIGPLVHAATTAGRGVRKGDAAATATSSRILRIYAIASVLVIIFGFGLMSSKRHGVEVAKFSQTWIWLSAVLWLIAVVLILAVVVPTLDKATALIGKQESVVSMTGKIAAFGGIVGILFVVVVFLMVYQPGK
ncbi:MAG: DUF2269 family protein [Jatrophihabitantaceae bacterium]